MIERAYELCMEVQAQADATAFQMKQVRCDQCGKDCTEEYLTEINPEGGFGRHRFLMCDSCLEAAPKGSYAADVRAMVKKTE